jgi:hypothetical protein
VHRSSEQLTLAPSCEPALVPGAGGTVSGEGWRRRIWPLADFVDGRDDAVAVTWANPDSSIYPVAYVRWGAVEEHLLDAMNEYRGSPHREQMASILAPLMRS